MDLSCVIENKVCNGLITFSVEWRAEQDILNGTMTMYYDCYVDTSKCASASIKNEGLGVSLDALGVPYTYGDSYKITRLDAVGKRKVSSFVSKPITIGENDIKGTLRCSFTDSGGCRAYTDLITYVDASHLDTATEGSFTVSGITRTTVGEVYGDYILGNEQTLSLTRKRTEFTHKVEYRCGTASGLLLDNSTTENLPFELPVDLSSQNKTGTTVNVTLDVTTYYNGQSLGTKTKTLVFTMPESVKPSCSFVVTDGTLRDGQQIKDIYGGYVREKSRFKIVIL